MLKYPLPTSAIGIPARPTEDKGPTTAVSAPRDGRLIGSVWLDQCGRGPAAPRCPFPNLRGAGWAVRPVSFLASADGCGRGQRPKMLACKSTELRNAESGPAPASHPSLPIIGNDFPPPTTRECHVACGTRIILKSRLPEINNS